MLVHQVFQQLVALQEQMVQTVHPVLLETVAKVLHLELQVQAVVQVLQV
jgi:hypothetical protein